MKVCLVLEYYTEQQVPGKHLLCAWETLENNYELSLYRLHSLPCLSAGGIHLLGAKDPEYLFATLQQPPTPIRAAIFKDTIMREEGQVWHGENMERPEGQPLYIVGMDAHSKVVSLVIYDWSLYWHPTVYKKISNIRIEDLEHTYRRHVPLDSLTILEVSTNSAFIKHTLCAIGYRAEVAKSDAISGIESKRKVCDITDAANLALAYIHGLIQEFVWIPEDETAEYREIYYAYRDCSKDVVRTANKIWSFCNKIGFRIQIVGGHTRADEIRKKLEEQKIQGRQRLRINMIVDDYERYMQRRKELRMLMKECVAANDSMIRLMQLPGVNFITSFALVAIIGDINRFPSAAKLSAYGGFAPMMNTSGEEERRARERGGTGKPLDNCGNRELKWLLVESAQTIMRSCKGTALGQFGWRLFFRKNVMNKVVCAVARKLLTYIWHVLRNDPTPNREEEELFKRKLIRFGSKLGKANLIELGYSNRTEFAEKYTSIIYSHLPPSQMNIAIANNLS